MDGVDAGPDNLFGLFVALSDEFGNVEDGGAAGILEREWDELCCHEVAIGGGAVQQAASAAEDGAEHLKGQIIGVALLDPGENHDAHLDGGLPDILDFAGGEVGQLVGGLWG